MFCFSSSEMEAGWGLIPSSMCSAGTYMVLLCSSSQAFLLPENAGQKWLQVHLTPYFFSRYCFKCIPAVDDCNPLPCWYITENLVRAVPLECFHSFPYFTLEYSMYTVFVWRGFLISSPLLNRRHPVSASVCVCCLTSEKKSHHFNLRLNQFFFCFCSQQ